MTVEELLVVASFVSAAEGCKMIRDYLGFQASSIDKEELMRILVPSEISLKKKSERYYDT